MTIALQSPKTLDSIEDREDWEAENGEAADLAAADKNKNHGLILSPYDVLVADGGRNQVSASVAVRRSAL